MTSAKTYHHTLSQLSSSWSMDTIYWSLSTLIISRWFLLIFCYLNFSTHDLCSCQTPPSLKCTLTNKRMASWSKHSWMSETALSRCPLFSLCSPSEKFFKKLITYASGRFQKKEITASSINLENQKFLNYSNLNMLVWVELLTICTLDINYCLLKLVCSQQTPYTWVLLGTHY